MILKQIQKRTSFCFLLFAVFITLNCSKAVLNSDNLDEYGSTRSPEKIAGQEVPFQTVLKGTNSLIRSPENIIITRQEDFFTLLERHYSPYMKIKYPYVSFSDSMVIACFMGEQSTGGYDLEISNVAIGKQEIIVTVQYKKPSPGQTVTDALTQPFHVISLKKYDLPVKYVIQDQSNNTSKVNLDFRVLGTGQFSNISDNRMVVIKDPESLKQLQSEMGLEKPILYKDSAGTSDIDFNKEMVIAVFRGEQRTVKTSITIDAIVQAENKITVSVVTSKELSPSSIPVISRPYCIAITKLSKVDVVFTVRERTVEPSKPPITPSDTTKIPPVQQEMLLNFYQEGGIAGLKRNFTIHTDLSYEITDNRLNFSSQGILSREDYTQLAELMQKCDFFNLKNAYGNSGTVRDQILRVIYYNDGNSQKKIAILDDSQDLPPEGLLNVESFINKLMSNLIASNPKPDSSNVPPNTKSILVRFYQEGGIAGFKRNFTIYDNQTCMYVDEQHSVKFKGIVDKDKLARLLELMGTSDFLKLKDIYGKPGAVTDQVTRVIYYESGDINKKIAILDDTNNPPPQLLQDIEVLIGQMLTDLLRENAK